jgi:hypothetical protein
MIVRIVGAAIVSVAVLVTVSLLVSFGMQWWTGGMIISASIGGVCGLAAAFALEALSTALGRVRERPCERPSNGNERSTGGPEHQGK